MNYYKQFAEMLDIDEIIRLPAQQQPDEFIAVIDQIEPIVRMRENRRLRRGFALLMARKALPVQRPRRLIARVTAVGQSFKAHDSILL